MRVRALPQRLRRAAASPPALTTPRRAGGVYHGKLLFPAAYPFKPPSILMLTPSGRFAVNQRLCLSLSDYHPESWNPMWSVASILTGLQSFFYEDTPTTGSVAAPAEERRLLAAASLEHNARVPLFAKVRPSCTAVACSYETCPLIAPHLGCLAAVPGADRGAASGAARAAA